MTKQMPGGPVDPRTVVQLKVHGGVGDLLWVHKVFCGYEQEIFYHISTENKARPHRSGIMAEHLPNVAGWRYDTTTFCAGGQDWGPPSDAACAIGMTWEQIKPKSGQVLRLECNKHLESGRRLEDWLPDLPTTHHFNFLPCAEPARVKFKPPYVIFHLAGWPDVPDPVWVRLIELFGGYAHVYVVGGTYDFRPRRIVEQLAGRKFVTLLEDLSWPDLHALLAGAAYCFGHASGFTALADVLRVPGVVNNPKQHPKLLGTWNSDTHPEQIHCTGAEFEVSVYRAYLAFAAGGAGVWPPGPAALRAVSPSAAPGAAVRALAETLVPTTLAAFVTADAPATLLADAVGAVYDNGCLPSIVALFGSTPDQVAEVYRVTARTTRPPAVHLKDAPDGLEPCEMVVVWVAGDPRTAADRARAGWKLTSSRGTLVVAGPAAEVATRAVASTLRIVPARVTGPADVFYISKRL